MKSIKLTERIREQITKTVIAETFAERDKALKARKNALAAQLYAQMVGEHAATMKRLPEDFFPRAESVRVGLGVDRYGALRLPFATPMRIPYRYESAPVYLAADSPFAPELQAICDALVARDKDAKTLRESLRGVLAAATTTGKLVETWPEVERYLPEDKTTYAYPAPVSADLNALIRTLAGA